MVEFKSNPDLYEEVLLLNFPLPALQQKPQVQELKETENISISKQLQIYQKIALH